MGCWQSTLSAGKPQENVQEKDDHQHQLKQFTHTPPVSHQPFSGGPESVVSPAFSEFSLKDLKAATNNFTSDFIVSESGTKAPNLVYKGRLQNSRWIAVKKFTKLAWPDPKQFAVFLCFLYSYIL